MNNWSDALKKLGACRSYADDADESVSAKEAWDNCVEPSRLVWLLARIGYARTMEQIVRPVTEWLSPRSVADCQTPMEAAEVLAVAVARSYGRPGYWELTNKIKQVISYEQVIESMRQTLRKEGHEY